MAKVFEIVKARIELDGDKEFVEEEKEGIEELKECINEAVSKIQELNGDNITVDDEFEELKEYLINHGLSEDEAEKVIEELQELGVDELYTSPYFNFYAEYSIKPTADAHELLEELACGYENWAEIEEDAAWESNPGEWFYDYVTSHYECKRKEILASFSYTDARFNRHYHEIRYEEIGDYSFLVYEKTGVGYGRRIRGVYGYEDVDELVRKLKEIQEEAGKTEDIEEYLELIDEALEVVGLDSDGLGRIKWAETW